MFSCPRLVFSRAHGETPVSRQGPDDDHDIYVMMERVSVYVTVLLILPSPFFPFLSDWSPPDNPA